MSLRSALRAQTADCHTAVDTLFGSFDLSRIQDYKAFLRARMPGSYHQSNMRLRMEESAVCCRTGRTEGARIYWLPT